ncbi:hypothetical protein M422DRAFT_775012 [Sphaerobolus stellatus SS14]|nr:hypothetical protein M422DRAFT_775012 [Sphaerobolus stellatus SS14]
MSYSQQYYPPRPPPLPPRTSRPAEYGVESPGHRQAAIGQSPPPLPARHSAPPSDAAPQERTTRQSPPAGALFPPGQWPTPELPLNPIGRYTILSTPTGPLNSATIQSALQSLGPNATLFLPQASVWDLESPIQLLEYQTLATWGYPTAERDMAALLAGRDCLPYVIKAASVSGARLRNVVVDGGREQYGYNGDAQVMLQFGNAAVDQAVDHCIIRNPRSWSCLQGFEGSTNFRITNNIIGPAGIGADKSKGQWADGISFAGTNGLIAGNLIKDATDGGIVVFGAPGTLVISNTVISQDRLTLGGINMVDWAPVSGNYVGTRVIHNTVKTFGSNGYFKTGIGQGPGVWWNNNPPEKVNRGAVVFGNLIDAESPPPDRGTFGYGYAVARDVKDWICVGNVSTDNVTYEGDISASLPTPNATPGPFVHDVPPDILAFSNTAEVGIRDPAYPRGKDVILQEEFRNSRGRISSLISIVPGASRILSYNAGQFNLQRGRQIMLKSIDLRYDPDNTIRIQRRNHGGQLQWQGGPGPSVSGDVLTYTAGGKLCITASSSQDENYTPVITYDFTPHLPLDATPGRETVLILADSAPHILISTPGGSFLFANEYVFKMNQAFRVGQIVARSCVCDGDPTPWTLIYTLNPYGQFVVLRNKQRAALIPSIPFIWPDPSQEAAWDWETLWSTPNDRVSQKDSDAVMYFQGDGNLVVYTSGGAVTWTSATHNRDPAATSLRFGVGTADAPWLEIMDSTGNRVWSS